MNPIIETFNLGKRYGSLQAVDNLYLNVAEGEIYGFLGLNGAGKTTTIRMLLGMIRPTTGFARVLETQVHSGQTKPWARVGYLVEIPHAYPELTVLENLEVSRRMHPGVPRSDIDWVIGRLNLSTYAGRLAGKLSQGNAQRLGLAKALLHRPKLLILDEPALGLDPAGIVEIRNLLLDQAHNQGVTVLMSSHILAEVARLADRIGVIHKGKLLKEMDGAQLENERRRRLLIRVRDVETACQTLAENRYSAVILPDRILELTGLSAIENPEAVNQLLVQSGNSPSYLAVEEENLEDYFLRLVGGQSEELHA